MQDFCSASICSIAVLPFSLKKYLAMSNRTCRIGVEVTTETRSSLISSPACSTFDSSPSIMISGSSSCMSGTTNCICFSFLSLRSNFCHFLFKYIWITLHWALHNSKCFTGSCPLSINLSTCTLTGSLNLTSPIIFTRCFTNLI